MNSHPFVPVVTYRQYLEALYEDYPHLSLDEKLRAWEDYVYTLAARRAAGKRDKCPPVPIVPHAQMETSKIPSRKAEREGEEELIQASEVPDIPDLFGIPCNRTAMSEFVKRAMVAQITFHKTRKELLTYFTRAISTPPFNSEITDQTFATIKSILDSRSDKMSDDKLLSFTMSILALRKELAPQAQMRTTSINLDVETPYIEQCRKFLDENRKLCDKVNEDLRAAEEILHTANRQLALANLQQKVDQYDRKKLPKAQMFKVVPNQIQHDVPSVDHLANGIESLANRLDSRHPIDVSHHTDPEIEQAFTHIARHGVKIESPQLQQLLGGKEHITMDMVHKFPDLIKIMRDMISTLKTTASVSIHNVLELVIGTLALVWAFVRSPSLDARLAIAIGFISLAGVTEIMINAFNLIVSQLWITMDHHPVAQVSDQENVFFAVVDIVRGMFSFNDPVTLKLNDKRASRLLAHFNLFQKTKDAFAYMSNMFTEAFYYVYEWKYGIPYHHDDQKKLVQDVIAWTHRAIIELNDDPVQKFRITPHYFFDYKKLMEDGQALSRMVMSEENLKRNLSNFFVSLQNMERVWKELKREAKTIRPRKPPIAVLFAGNPGVGKSVATNLYAKFMCDIFGKEYNNDTVYPRDPSDEFWDGYKNNYMCLLDDYNQRDQVDIRGDCHEQFIRMVGPNPMPLKMPDIESKGTTYFTSEHVLLTANLPPILTRDKVQLQNMEAFKRRVHVLVLVEHVGHEGANYVVDYGKPLSPDWYKFYIGDPFKADPFSGAQPLTFVQFMSYCVNLKLKNDGTDKDIIKTLMDSPKFFEKEIQQFWALNPNLMVPIQLPIKAQCNEQSCKHFKKRKDCPELSDLEYELANQIHEEALLRDYILYKEPKTYMDAYKNAKVELQKLKLSLTDQVMAFVRQNPMKVTFAAALSFLAAFGAIGAVLYWMSTKKETHLPIQCPDCEREGLMDEEAQTSQGTIRRSVERRQARKPHPVGHYTPRVTVAQVSHTIDDVVEHVVANNAARISVMVPPKIRHANACFIGGRMFYTIGHIFSEKYPETGLTLNFQGRSYEFPRNQLKIAYLEEQDVSFVVILDPTFPTVKSIVHHFVTEEDLNQRLGSTVALVTRGRTNELIVQTMNNCDIDSVLEYSLGQKILSSQRILFGNIPTADGDCGGTYVVCNPRFVRKLFGIHIAGNGTQGFGTILTQEVIKEAMRVLLASPVAQTAVIKITPYDREKSKTKLPEKIEDNIEIIGNIEPEHHLPAKTFIQKSPLCGLFTEPIEIPAQLGIRKKKDGTEVDPAVGMFKKLNRPSQCNADTALLDHICEQLPSQFPLVYAPWVLDLHEALNGIAGLGELVEIVITTSAGYPENTQHLGPGKTPYVYRGPDGKLRLTEQFLEKYKLFLYRLEHDWDALQNDPEFVTCCYNLKDERVAKEKVWDQNGDPVGNTRGMSSTSLCVLLAMRQYFGAFVANNIAAHNTHPCSMGINPHSSEWMQVRRRLERYGLDRIRAGDFSKFDASLKHQVTSRVWAAIDKWYQIHSGDWQPNHSTIRARLHDIIHNALCILRDVLFRTKGGNQSGQLLTTIENVWDLVVIVIYSLMIWAMESGIELTVSEAFEILIILAFGDDHAFTLPEEFDAFDCIVLARIVKQHFDMDYTSPDKVKALKPLYNISEITYLCRKIVARRGRTFAPLLLEIIDDMINFVNTKVLTVPECVDAVTNSAMYEWYHHGPELFDLRKNVLNAALARLGLKQKTQTWDEIDCQILGNTVPIVAQMEQEDTKPLPVFDDDYVQHMDLGFNFFFNVNDKQREQLLAIGTEIQNFVYRYGPHQHLMTPKKKEKKLRKFSAKLQKKFKVPVTITPRQFEQHCALLLWEPARQWAIEKVIKQSAAAAATAIERPHAQMDEWDNYVAPDIITDVGRYNGLRVQELREHNILYGEPCPPEEEDTWSDYHDDLSDHDSQESDWTDPGDVEEAWVKDQCLFKSSWRDAYGRKWPTGENFNMNYVDRFWPSQFGERIKFKMPRAQSLEQPAVTVTRTEQQQVTNPQASQAKLTVTFGDNTTTELPGLTQNGGVQTPVAKSDDPYIDQGISKIITRPYLVDTITWNGTDVTGAAIYAGFFPDLLLMVPNIIEKLNRFQFLRTGVQVDFKINGTAFHFGCLQLSYVPHYNVSDSVIRYFQTMFIASNLDTHLLSPNTNASVSIQIPFVTPSRFQNLADWTGEPGFTGAVNAFVHAPLRLASDGTDPVITISVFANFIEPRAAGLGLRSQSLIEEDGVIASKLRAYDSLDTKRKTRYVFENPRAQVESVDATKSMDVRTLFETPFPGLIDASMSAEKFVSMGETVSSWTELFRRFTLVKQDTNTGSNEYNTWYEPYTDTVGEIGPMARMLRTFHYKRGSFRVKAFCRSFNTNVGMSALNYYGELNDPNVTGFNGFAFTQTNTRPVIEAQVPFYNPYDMTCNADYDKETAYYPAMKLELRNLTALATNFACEVDWYASLGDDFSVGWPAVPVPLKTGPALPSAQMSESEQDQKTEKGTQSSKYIKSAKKQVASMVTPIKSEMSSILGFLSELGGALMDKPTDLQATTKVRLDVLGGLANANGLDSCEPLSLEPSNKVAYDHSMFGKKRDYNLFSNYKLLPALIKNGFWDGDANPGDIIFTLLVTPMYVHRYTQGMTPNAFTFYELTHMSNLADKFLWWRGSIKYTLYIWTSKYTSGRIVVSWIPDPTTGGAIANDEFGDVVSHTVDFTGDTKYSFSIPYLRENAWAAVGQYSDPYLVVPLWRNNNGQIIVRVLNALTISTSTGTAIVYYSVFASCGEDFDVARPRDLPTTYQDGSTVSLPQSHPMTKRSGVRTVARVKPDNNNDNSARGKNTKGALVTQGFVETTGK